MIKMIIKQHNVLIDAKKAKEIVLRHLMNDEVVDEYTVGKYKK